tara:strand:- start:5412 stop:5633 length:222 start_codon:yes stop_codon:yes gene_type:complete
MSTFIFTFAIMLIMAVAMAVGLIIKNKSIEGSCGGIANLGLKKVCECENPCDKKKAKLEAEKQKAMLNENRII